MKETTVTANAPTLEEVKEWVKMRIWASEGIDANWNRMFKAMLNHLPKDVCVIEVKPRCYGDAECKAKLKPRK